MIYHDIIEVESSNHASLIKKKKHMFLSKLIHQLHTSFFTTHVQSYVTALKGSDAAKR